MPNQAAPVHGVTLDSSPAVLDVPAPFDGFEVVGERVLKPLAHGSTGFVALGECLAVVVVQQCLDRRPAIDEGSVVGPLDNPVPHLIIPKAATKGRLGSCCGVGLDGHDLAFAAENTLGADERRQKMTCVGIGGVDHGAGVNRSF